MSAPLRKPSDLGKTELEVVVNKPLIAAAVGLVLLLVGVPVGLALVNSLRAVPDPNKALAQRPRLLAPERPAPQPALPTSEAVSADVSTVVAALLV